MSQYNPNTYDKSTPSGTSTGYTDLPQSNEYLGKLAQKLTKTSVYSFAAEIVGIVKDYVSDFFYTKVPQMATAEVVSVNIGDKGIEWLDLRIYDGQNTIIHNVQNTTSLSLDIKDQVKIAYFGNNLQTAFIISKVAAVPQNTTLRVTNSVMSIPTADCYLRYTGTRWWLVFSDDFYNNEIKPRAEEISYNVNDVLTVKKQTRLRIGVQRHLSCKNSPARIEWAHWGERIPQQLQAGNGQDLVVPTSVGSEIAQPLGASYYTKPVSSQITLPGSIGRTIAVDSHGKPMVEEIITAENCLIDVNYASCSPLPAIEVTNIINNSIFIDDYVFRRSHNKAVDYYDDFGYWYKTFGIYIQAFVDSNANELQPHCSIIYQSSEEELYTVKIKSKLSCRQYGVSNMTVDGNEIILDGNIVQPYVVQSEYIRSNFNYKNFRSKNIENNSGYSQFITNGPYGSRLKFRVLDKQ